MDNSPFPYRPALKNDANSLVRVFHDKLAEQLRCSGRDLGKPLMGVITRHMALNAWHIVIGKKRYGFHRKQSRTGRRL